MLYVKEPCMTVATFPGSLEQNSKFIMCLIFFTLFPFLFQDMSQSLQINGSKDNKTTVPTLPGEDYDVPKKFTVRKIFLLSSEHNYFS